MLLLIVILISPLSSFTFLITALVFKTITLELLSPSSIAILTKINYFSTQSVTASPVFLIILISY
jgi:hypothetical protein